MVQAPLNSTQTQLALPKALWVTWFVSVLLLTLVGGTLLFFPAIAKAYWPWPLAPFNIRLLGAIYASAALPLIGYLLKPQLSYLRVILPIFACFTTFFLLVSIAHVGIFLPRKASAIWFFLYGADSFVGLYYCWHLRQQLMMSTPKPHRPRLYRGQTLALGFYGLGLLLLAPIFGKWWPWPLNPFHSHLYSGVFLTAALAMELLRDRASVRERLWFGMTQLCLGLLTFLGALVVDFEVQRLDWTFLSTWLWQLVFIGFTVIGGWILVKETQALSRES